MKDKIATIPFLVAFPKGKYIFFLKKTATLFDQKQFEGEAEWGPEGAHLLLNTVAAHWRLFPLNQVSTQHLNDMISMNFTATVHLVIRTHENKTSCQLQYFPRGPPEAPAPLPKRANSPIGTASAMRERGNILLLSIVSTSCISSLQKPMGCRGITFEKVSSSVSSP